ncbi:MAG TPA: hypothetical protein VF165_22900 [Nocardioidaceae bacterium]
MSLSVTRALRIWVLAAILAVTVTVLPPLSPVGAMPIEGIPSYDPQRICSPSPKTGTVMLENYLLRKYKGTGSSGISRACTASGISEHKEGRAFDWRISAGSARDRRYARDFLGNLMRTDRAGHRKAMARRMGIMYIIWNDHIWSASHGYRRRDYLHPACSKLSTCGTTLRHRDHMHISLTWAGARAKTSWYERRLTGKPSPAPAPAPAPSTAPKPEPKFPEGVLDLRDKPYTTISVPANGETVETKFKLREGVTYSLTAGGLYTYGAPHQVGDAVCTWSSSKDSWVTHPTRTIKRRYGRLALEVNGGLAFDSDCRRSHAYRTDFTSKRESTLKLRVIGNHPSATGRLTVVIGRRKARVGSALPSYPTLSAAPESTTRKRGGYGLLAENVTVPASATRSTYTKGKLRSGVTYRVTVSGVAQMGEGVLTDGKCLSVGGAWYSKATIDRRVPDQDHGNLYLNGAPMRSRGSTGCGTEPHSVSFTPDVTGRLRLDLWDPLDHSDNSGDLQVKVQRVTPIATPQAAAGQRPRVRRVEWKQSRDWFEVDPSDPDGTLSTMKLRKGDRVQVIVRGKFSTGGYDADASCVKTPAGWLQADPAADLLGQDPLNLWVDGQPVRWRALGPTDGCSSEYRYTTRFTLTEHNGPLRVSVFDLDYRDNKGSFEVTLLRDED